MDPTELHVLGCSIQYCPASKPFTPAGRPGQWTCIGHRWPGGEGNASQQVSTPLARDADSTFYEGVLYRIVVEVNKDVLITYIGVFDLVGTTSGRLRFFDEKQRTSLAVRPEWITTVVALT